MRLEFSDQTRECLESDTRNLEGIYTYRGVQIDETWDKESLLMVALHAMSQLVDERKRHLKHMGISDDREFAVRRPRYSFRNVLGLGAVLLGFLWTTEASAQWGYTPIEYSRSYRQVGRYSGSVYPGAAYWGGDYRTIYQPVTVYLRWDATDPLVGYRRGW